MEEIGEKFKETRESMDIMLDEVSLDLDIPIRDLENIELGNIKNIGSVVLIKEIITKYSKYLGLDPDVFLDEYNEVLFDQTSKISLDDIKNAKKMLHKNEEKKFKVSSPYTVITKQKKNYLKIILVVLVILLGSISVILINNNQTESSVIE